MKYYRRLNRLPVLRLLMPLMAGIILQYHFAIPCRLLIPMVIFVFLLLVLLFLNRQKYSGFDSGWKYGLLIHIFILLLSMAWTGRIMEYPSFMDHSGQGDRLVAVIRENPQERENTIRIIVEVSGVISGTGWINTSGRAVAWLEKDIMAADLDIGDRIVMPNRVQEIKNAGNPFEFDYRRHMYFQGVYGQVYLPAGSWFRIEDHSRRELELIPAKLRNRLLEILQSTGLTGREYSVASAMLLGSRDELDHETRQIYSGSGAMHILAVSGLHVGIVYIFLIWILGPFKRIRYFRVMTAVVILLVIWFYAMITGLSPSVIRAATMFSFLSFARAAGKQSGTLNILASAAFFQLLANPFSLFMVGFQLSYLAVAGIISFQPVIYSLFRFKNMLSGKLWALVSLSVSAQILIFPLIIFYFNQFPTWFLLTNIAAVPLASLILYSGLFLFLFSFVPLLFFSFSFILNSALLLLNFITESISHLPGSKISGITLSIPEVLTVYAIIICVIIFISLKKVRFFKYVLISIAVLLAFRADSTIRTNNRDVFIVYNAGNTSLYNFISGKNSIIVSGPAGGETEVPYVATSPAMRLKASDFYLLSHNEFFRKNLSPVPSIILTEGNYVFFAGKRIVFADSREVVYPLDSDILVVSSLTLPDISSICLALSPSVVVIDPSVPYFRKTRIMEQCINLGIPFHDVRESGAFMMHMPR